MIHSTVPQLFELWTASAAHPTPGRVVAWWSLNGATSHVLCVAVGESGVRILDVAAVEFHTDEAAALAAAS